MLVSLYFHVKVRPNLNLINIGIVGGKFLRRDRYINKITGKYFSLDDFKVNAKVDICGRSFLIISQSGYGAKNTQSNRVLTGFTKASIDVRSMKLPLHLLS